MKLQSYIMLFCFYFSIQSYMKGQITQHQDIGVIAIPSLNNTCFFTGNETITVEIKNFSIVPVLNFPVSYQISNGQVVTELYNGFIFGGHTKTHTFTQSADLSTSRHTSIRAWTNEPNDTIYTNDTTLFTIDCTCYDTLGTPYICNQMVSQYYETSTMAERDSAQNYLESLGIVIIDSLTCGTTHINLLTVPDSILIGGVYLQDESLKEALQVETLGKENIDFNFLIKKEGFSSKTKQNIKGILNPIQFQEENGNISPHPVKIAILDTGLDTLSNLFLPYRLNDVCSNCTGLPNITFGYDYVNKIPNPSDDNGHGTMVASIIAKEAATHNLNIDIIPLKVLNDTGEGNLWTVCLGTVAARQLKADIINASFGWIGTSSLILKKLIDGTGDYCHGLFVTSAGNEASSNDIIPHWPSNYSIHLDNVVAVTAWESNSNGTIDIANYANYGVQTIDVAVKGEHSVVGLNGVTEIATGSSLSAAYFSGLAANWFYKNEQLQASQLKSLSHKGNALLDLSGNGLVVARSSIQNIDTMMLSLYADTMTINATCHICTCLDSCADFNILNELINISADFDFKTYPNPFQDWVRFDFELEKRDVIQLWIYDILGQQIYHTKRTLSQGEHQVEWNGSFSPKGTYIVYIQTNTKKGRQLLIKQ